MKKSIFLLMFMIIGIMVNAQIVKLEDIEKVKSSKLIVALTGDATLDETFKAVITKYWTFSEVAGYEEEESAMKKAKNSENILVIKLGTKSSRSLTHHTAGSTVAYQTISTGKSIDISEGKGNPMITQYITSFGDDVITEEIMVFGITALQYMCKTMDEKQLASNMKLTSAYKEKSKELKEKTLYLAEGWLDKKFDINKIPELYDGKIKVVSYEDWRDAILTSAEGIAYCIVVPYPIGGDYSYMHYLVDAKTASVLAICYPKAAVSVAGVNVSKSNTGYINSKNISMYNDAGEGKW